MLSRAQEARSPPQNWRATLCIRGRRTGTSVENTDVRIVDRFRRRHTFTWITQILRKKPATSAVKASCPVFDFCEVTRMRILVECADGRTRALRDRVSQVYDRIETQLRQCLQWLNWKKAGEQRYRLTPANMLLATAEEKLQFVRSNFSQSPTDGWEDQWSIATAWWCRCPKVNSLAK